MNTDEKTRRLTRAELHNNEERIKRAFRDQLAELASLLEVLLALLVLIGLILGAVPLVKWMPGLLEDGNAVDVSTFLQRALDVVIGI